MGGIRGKEERLQGPLLASRGPRHPEEPVRPPPPTVPRPELGRTRSRSAAFPLGRERGGGGPGGTA